MYILKKLKCELYKMYTYIKKYKMSALFTQLLLIQLSSVLYTDLTINTTTNTNLTNSTYTFDFHTFSVCQKNIMFHMEPFSAKVFVETKNQSTIFHTKFLVDQYINPINDKFNITIQINMQIDEYYVDIEPFVLSGVSEYYKCRNFAEQLNLKYEKTNNGTTIFISRDNFWDFDEDIFDL